jgi:hypothetical protein
MRKRLEVSDVVVMQVRDDHRRDRLALDAGAAERLERRAQAGAAAACADDRIEPGVDENRLATGTQDPEVVGHLDLGVGFAVGLVAVVELALSRRQRAVADRDDLVGHGCRPAPRGVRLNHGHRGLPPRRRP